MAGTGSRRTGSARSAGAATQSKRADAYVRDLIRGSTGSAFGFNNIRPTNRSETQLRAISQLKGLPPTVRAGLRNSANITRTNRQLSAANSYIQGSGGYYTNRRLREVVGRSRRQLENSARTAKSARAYLAAKLKDERAPRNNRRPAWLTPAGRQARVAKILREELRNNIRPFKRRRTS